MAFDRVGFLMLFGVIAQCALIGAYFEWRYMIILCALIVFSCFGFHSIMFRHIMLMDLTCTCHWMP